MAEFVLPPEMEAFAEAAGDAAMGPFQAADFDADPSAAFSDGMGAAMDFMSDAGMPTEMMDQRREHFRKITANQMDAVDNNLMRENDPRMPIFNDRKSNVTFGKG